MNELIFTNSATIEIIIFLFTVSAIGGFIDAIAGGGGLIMLPSILFTGISPHLAMGCNKFAATFGTGMAVWNFAKKGLIIWKIVIIGILFTLVGSFLGSRLVLSLDATMVGKIIVFLLPLAAIPVLIPRKDKTEEYQFSNNDFWIKIPLLCLIIGFYDGFFGPATGTLLIIGLHTILHLNLLKASANAKVFNLGSNISALINFVLSGKIIYSIAIPMALGNVLGNYLGSKMAIRKGQNFIRFFIAGVLIILTITLIMRYY